MSNARDLIKRNNGQVLKGLAGGNWEARTSWRHSIAMIFTANGSNTVLGAWIH
jgi:hypothetical protein